MQHPDPISSFPFVLVGPAPEALSALALAAYPDLPSLHTGIDAYILFTAPTDRPAVLEQMTQLGLSPTQAIFLNSAAACSLGSGALLSGAVDSAEETKNKLFSSIRAQRQRQLGAALALHPPENPAAADRMHLAHAFACALDFAPARHRGLILSVSQVVDPQESIWEAKLSLDEALSLTACLAIEHWRNPAEFREKLRLKAARLPFRLRTELRDLTERCLDSAWRAHVA